MNTSKPAIVVKKMTLTKHKSNDGVLTEDQIRASARKTRQAVMTLPKTHEVITFIELE